jgi:hypothetical protein
MRWAYDPFERRRLAACRWTQLVNRVFVVIEGLIALRVDLKALGADPAAGFAQFIYGVTTLLVHRSSACSATPVISPVGRPPC